MGRPTPVPAMAPRKESHLEAKVRVGDRVAASLEALGARVRCFLVSGLFGAVRLSLPLAAAASLCLFL